MADLKLDREIVRIMGRLREVVTIKDAAGNIERVMRPIMIEFYPRDVVQVAIGASLLAIPLAVTEEVWNLAAELPMLNILIILFMSLMLISVFVYYNYYRDDFFGHWDEFLKRVLTTYILSFVVVAGLLTVIERAPWSTDILLAVKRTILVGFPASMSATVVDVIR